jgi:hypothetical protein
MPKRASGGRPNCEASQAACANLDGGIAWTGYALGTAAEIYQKLLAAIRAGKFDEFGVWFLNPDPRDRRRLRVTKAMVENMLEIFGSDINEKKSECVPGRRAVSAALLDAGYSLSASL